MSITSATDTVPLHLDGHTIEAKLPADWTGISPLQRKSVVLFCIENADRKDSFYEKLYLTAINCDIHFQEFLRREQERETDTRKVTHVDNHKKIIWIETLTTNKSYPDDDAFRLEKLIYKENNIFILSYYFCGKLTAERINQAEELINQTKIS